MLSFGVTGTRYGGTTEQYASLELLLETIRKSAIANACIFEFSKCYYGDGK